MKTVLIATNFSPASRNASLCGIALAKALKANTILFNALNAGSPPSPGSEILYEEKRENK